MTAPTVYPTHALPSIRNEIATNTQPRGWVRDRRGVMRYAGDLDADYADELAEAGIRPDRPECTNSGRPRVEIDIAEAIRLRRVEGLTLAEIGRRLGTSASTIAGRLNQAAA